MKSAGPNDGHSSAYAFDVASNRKSVVVAMTANNDGDCSFAISGASIGAQQGGVMRFRITKTGNCADSTMLSYVSRDGTAVGLYVPASSSVPFRDVPV